MRGEQACLRSWTKWIIRHLINDHQSSSSQVRVAQAVQGNFLKVVHHQGVPANLLLELSWSAGSQCFSMLVHCSEQCTAQEGPSHRYDVGPSLFPFSPKAISPILSVEARPWPNLLQQLLHHGSLADLPVAPYDDLHHDLFLFSQNIDLVFLQ